ncbi:MAG: hypothetical protein ACHQ1H_11825, partial [Nitrososphaerales archaeon]
LVDLGLFAGSLGLTLLLLLFSVLGFHQSIDISIHLDLAFYLPLSLGASGIIVNFIGGEIDRKKLAKNFEPYPLYKFLFYLSSAAMILAVIVGAIMNPQIVISTISTFPFIAAGIALVFLLSFIILKSYSSKPLPADSTKEPTII